MFYLLSTLFGFRVRTLFRIFRDTPYKYLSGVLIFGEIEQGQNPEQVLI